jgi:hypothetical protein
MRCPTNEQKCEPGGYPVDLENAAQRIALHVERYIERRRNGLHPIPSLSVLAYLATS